MSDIEHYRQFREELLPILRCVACRSERLTLVGGEIAAKLPFRQSPEHLACSDCGAEYPITEDALPVMWTPKLRRIFEGESAADSNLKANIRIYEEISDRYLAHTRNYPGLARRMQKAAKRFLDEANGSLKYHLDFGSVRGKS